MNDELKVNTKFRNLIPNMSKEEYLQLEKNILDAGCVLEPILTWQGMIIDGHHRYEIAREHGITYETHEMDFADEEEAMIWICSNQLGRRNLDSKEYKYIMGKRYELEMQQHGGNHMSQASTDDQTNSETQERTSAKIGTEYGVSERTVRRAYSYAKAIDDANDIIPGFRSAANGGSIKFSEDLLLRIMKEPETNIKRQALQLILDKNADGAEELIPKPAKMDSNTEGHGNNQMPTEATASSNPAYATAIDHLEGLEPGFREMINDGAVKITDSFLQKIMETPYDTQKEIMQCMIKDECEKAQKILDKALNKGSGSEDPEAKDEEPAIPADNKETAEAEAGAAAERTAEEDALDDELDKLVYGMDDFQRELNRASDQYLDTINDLLFISQYDFITTERGNKIAALELKAHIHSVRDALEIVNDTPTAP